MAPRVSRFDDSRLEGALSDYTDGSLLYMYFENFVTYDRCELYPGPHMNMLMGPNGSGKSSVIAAMALGLGWHPTVLGRSKDIAEFIKYGREHAILETAMRISSRPAGLEEEMEWREDGILILRRELHQSRTGGGGKTSRHSSEWFINGHQCTAKLVAQIMSALNVQIDNLCQFLPQDKVSEFAKLTPAELLVETEKATAEPLVHANHQELITLSGKEKELAQKSEDLGKRLDFFVKQNENVEGLIQRIQQREQHMRTIKLCEQKRPWLLYNSARDAYLGAREVRDNAKTALERALEASNPLRLKLREAQEGLVQTERKKTTKARKADQLKGNLADIVEEEIPRLATDIAKLKSLIIKLREQKTKREATIVDLRRAIRQAEQELDQTPPPRVDEDPLRAEINEANRRMADVDNEMGEVEEQVKRISREGDRITKEIDECAAELRRLEDVRVQRLEIARKISIDVYNAYNWIQSHRDMFREPVYGPICLEVNVKDPSLARQVESVISKGIFLNFVVTNYEDYEVLMSNVCEQQGFKINVTILENTDISTCRTSLDRGDLKKLGFVGTVLDMVDGPPAVLAALVDTAKIHLIPIGKVAMDNARVEACSKQIQKYATNEGCFEIRRSHYSEDVAVRCTVLKMSLFLSQSSSDERKQKLTDRIGERRAELARNQERMKRLYQEQELLRRKAADARSAKDGFNQRRTAILQEFNEWKRKKQALELKRSNLSKLVSTGDAQANEEELSEAVQKVKRLYGEYADSTLLASRKLSEYREMILVMASEHLIIAKYEGEVARWQEELRISEAQHETLRRLVADAEEELATSKKRAKDLLDHASKSQIDEEARMAFAELPETLEELDRMLAVERARADMSEDSAMGRATLSDYEERKDQIAQLEQSLTRLHAEQRDLQVAIASLKEQWMPQVEAMAKVISGRFSDFFAQMGCVGQVRLAIKGNDFAQYALEILVKFRDEEALQVLSAQRQSGGEKSVSTILYLLALQELARSPFRVVDEINQGMDAQNERRVHALIVETATRTARSQYREFCTVVC